MTGSFPLTIETPDAIATQVLNVLFYGLPVEELQSFRERVNAVRPTTSSASRGYYLQPDRLSIVLVGNAAAFAVAAARARVRHVRNHRHGRSRSAWPPTSSARGPRLRPARGLAAPARAGAPRINRIRAIGAVRAADASSRRTCRSRAACSRRSSRRRADSTGCAASRPSSRRRRRPDSAPNARAGRDRDGDLPRVSESRARRIERRRREHRPGVRRHARVGEGSRAASTTCPNADGARPRGESASATRSRVLLAAHDGRVRVRLLPDVKDETGRRAPRARVLGADDLDPMVLYVDPASHLDRQADLRRRRRRPAARRGAVQRLPRGRRRPDRASRDRPRRAAKPVLERRVTKFAINAPLAPALFTRPVS